MSRRFALHEQRQSVLLDGLWDFTYLGQFELDEVSVHSLVFADVMAVPGCFDATPRYAAQQGVVAYRRRIVISDDTPHRLSFAAVNHRCRVFVGGKRVAVHEWGFTSFHVDLKGMAPGPSELIVLVDNRVGPPHSLLHQPYFDWYCYGGITQSVRLERLGPLWIDSVEISTQAISPPRLALTIRYGATSAGVRTRLAIRFEGEPRHVETLTLPDTEGVLERVLELPGSALWSPEQPHLHLCQIELGGDDFCQRIGLRKVELRGQELMLNGKKLTLRGVNRHQSHPELGHAQCDAVELADIQLLKQLGANFVRASHYPMNSTFLDLCDEAGILVWNESIGWQHKREHLTNPHFLEAQQSELEEMLAMSRNHACIVLWGILNESASNDEACRPAYARLLGRLRELDPSRPVTYASNHPSDDVCFDLADVISVNCYPGWYGGSLAEIPAALDRMLTDLERQQPGKPIIISEIGAAGLYGWHDWHHGRWSEDYQAELLESALGHLFGGGRVAGVAIWQFCDMRTSDALPIILGRPRGFNNKGLVDEYRRPKAAFGAVRKLYQKLAAEGR